MSAWQIGRKFSEETKAKLRNRVRSDRSGKPKVQIEVFDLETNIKTIYPSISEMARVLKVHKGSVSKYLSCAYKRPFKGKERYILKIFNP